MSNTEYTISLPFTLGVTGTVQTTTDQNKIWQDRVLSVVGTAIGERAQRYYFGSKVHFEVFDGVTHAEEVLPGVISSAFATYLPLLSFKRIDTSYSRDTGTLSVTVYYALPDNTVTSVQVGNVQINGTQPPKEF